jgi:type 1 fimbria pilin
MKSLILGLLVMAAALAAAQGKQTFTGTITDSMCADADHSQMRMGPTDAECTVACVGAHGATYVLFDGKDAYTLSDQRTPERFAGQKVTVIGTLDARTRTIQVDSMTAAR